MSTNDIQNGLTPIADNCDQLRTKSGQAQWVNTLQWVHDRLVNIHRENPAVDYMRKFRATIADIADCLVTPPAPVEVKSGQGDKLIALTHSQLRAKANAWMQKRQVITDDGEVHPQCQAELAKLLAFIDSLATPPAPVEAATPEPVETITASQAMGKSWIDPESSPGPTFGEAWDIQKSVGPSLDHDPKCSSVPGHHPFSGPALLCDCGAVEREWKRRKATMPATRPPFA